MKDQMVCSDSECLTKDLVQGALSDLGTFTISSGPMTASLVKMDVQKYMSVRTSILVAGLAYDAKPEIVISQITAI